jgi:hypothetical protein
LQRQQQLAQAEKEAVDKAREEKLRKIQDQRKKEDETEKVPENYMLNLTTRNGKSYHSITTIGKQSTHGGTEGKSKRET